MAASGVRLMRSGHQARAPLGYRFHRRARRLSSSRRRLGKLKEEIAGDRAKSLRAANLGLTDEALQWQHDLLAALVDT